MKVVMAGYEATKKIISASSYLTNKYLIGDFDVIWLNTGSFDGKLYCGRYEDIGKIGSTSEDWMRAITEYFNSLEDEFIIWGSDDFFLSREINKKSYNKLLNKIKSDQDIVCAKLCVSLFHKPSEYTDIGNDIFMLNETAEYSSVVQFCIWKRDFLVEMLRRSTTPWEFEIEGSKRLNATGKKVIGTFDSALKYPDRTATTGSRPGKVSVWGNRVEDIEFLIKEGHLNRDDLIMGLWPGDVKTYEEGKDNQLACLESCHDKEYNEMLLELCLG